MRGQGGSAGRWRDMRRPRVLDLRPNSLTRIRRAARFSASGPGSVSGAQATTIEGGSPDSWDPVRQAWLAEDVPQCGYRQSEQIMAVSAYL
jgi:hypothetical protein